MHRNASPLSLFLLGAGVFLLVLAPLLVWYVQPQAKRTPIDTDTTTVFTGTGSYFDTGEVKTVTGKEITITRQVRGDVAESLKSGHAVWDVSTSVDRKESLPASDPRDALQWTLERWVTDRYTNEPVHCCEETPRFDGEAYLKFPFDVERRAYRWWDGTLGGVVRLDYAGRKKIQGYEGYLFKGTVEPTRTGERQVPGVLVGESDTPQILAEEWYSNSGIELVVDQRTGRIINAAIGPKKTLRAPGSSKDAVTLLESERVEFTEETQKKQVELASADSDRLALLSGTAPAGAVGGGLVLTAAGLVLVIRGRRTEPEAPNTHMMTKLPT
ncbi:DUF3068 domain-containing protein [Streptomyces griseus]|uniref:DUF3068 domain-containing protein n=1 Tax=Streptomyces stephensoniae TaxID=3375367 RepID=A0ABU2VXW3_9ACTN|nr:DUF3068 domain-containing protein [Streptomyces griseus]MDT0490135.1 DUF3068 domain-containing protein [Streptomyces griseus]